MTSTNVPAFPDSPERDLAVTEEMNQEQTYENPPPSESKVDQQMVLTTEVQGKKEDLNLVTTLGPALTTLSLPKDKETVNVEEDRLIISEPHDETQYHLAEVGECFLGLFTHNNRLSDVTIEIGNDTFLVHKVTLMAHSDYFCQLFYKGKKRLSTIQLSGIPAPAFQLVLDFLYSGKVALTMENIADIYTTAQQLVIKDLIYICNRKLYNLSARNALIILHTSSNIEADICRHAFVTVAKSFHEIKDSQHLKIQRFGMFMMILACDNLVVANEMDVFNSAMSWLYADYNFRIKCITPVLGQVRFCYMTSTDLLNCTDTIIHLPTWEDSQPFLLRCMWHAVAIRHRRQPLFPIPLPPERPYLKRSAEIRTNMNVNNASIPSLSLTRYKAKGAQTIKTYSTFAEFENSTPVNRKTVSTNLVPSILIVEEADKAVLVVGGANASSVLNAEEVGKSIYAYRPRHQTWKRVGGLPKARNFHAVAFMLDCLFVVGGAKPIDAYERYYIPTDTVHRWNLKSKNWRKCANMKRKRLHHSVETLCNRLYALGGQDEHSKVLKSVEEYNPVSNRWKEVSPLRIGRIGMGVSSHNGKLIVAGGYNDICTSIMKCEPMLATVETYQPATDTWSFIADLPSPRFHCTLLSVNDDLYVCGGAICAYMHTGKTHEMVSVNDVYKYKYDLNMWQEFGRLKSKRHGSPAVVVGSSIIVLGGVSLSPKKKVFNTIEKYDVKSGSSTFTELGGLAQLAMGVTVCDSELLEGVTYVPESQTITMI